MLELEIVKEIEKLCEQQNKRKKERDDEDEK